MKLHPDDIEKEFEFAENLAIASLDPELVRRARAFEDKWTAKGIPAHAKMRYSLGLTTRFLEAKGCSRELLHQYIDAVLDEVARMEGRSL